MPRRRIIAEATPPESANAPANYTIEDIELDEEGSEISLDEMETERPSVKSGIVVTTQEPVRTMRSGQEVMRSGGIMHRVFSPETHGTDWREEAMQFIDTCNVQDGERRPKYIQHKEY